MMSGSYDLTDFDDAAIRMEILKILNRDKEWLESKVAKELEAQAKVADRIGPEAREQIRKISETSNARSVQIYEKMKRYVERSR